MTTDPQTVTFILKEICKQEYAGNNCKISAGFVEADGVDTVYLKLEKDGVKPTTLFLRPDELQAIVWVSSGTLWSNEIKRMDVCRCAKDSGQAKEIYSDKLSEYISLCRSALNGIITPQTAKQEKIDYGFKALKILTAIEAEYHGLTPDEEGLNDN